MISQKTFTRPAETPPPHKKAAEDVPPPMKTN